MLGFMQAWRTNYDRPINGFAIGGQRVICLSCIQQMGDVVRSGGAKDQHNDLFRHAHVIKIIRFGHACRLMRPTLHDIGFSRHDLMSDRCLCQIVVGCFTTCQKDAYGQY